MSKEHHICPLFLCPVGNAVIIPVYPLFMPMDKEQFFSACEYHFLIGRIPRVIVVAQHIMERERWEIPFSFSHGVCIMVSQMQHISICPPMRRSTSLALSRIIMGIAENQYLHGLQLLFQQFFHLPQGFASVADGVLFLRRKFCHVFFSVQAHRK